MSIRNSGRWTWGLVLGVLVWSGTALALDPDENCEALKNRDTGKLAFCLQRAEAKLVKTKGTCSESLEKVCYRESDCTGMCGKDTTKYTDAIKKCNDKFLEKWGKDETKGEGTCPDTITDPNSMLDFVTAHSNVVAAALAGEGLLPLAPLLKTGQTQCDQGAGVLGDCATGSPGGQDGSLQKGMARSYTDNGNGTITDNKTGLIWEELDDNNLNGIHDYSVLPTNFNWYNAFKRIQVLNGDASGCIAANVPDACCSGAGTGSCSAFLGQTDWRLPNRLELESLLVINPPTALAIDPVFNSNCTAGCVAPSCSCTVAGGYWTSTTSLSTTGCAGGAYCNAYGVEFGSGAIQPNKLKSTVFFSVRAVRGGL
jgi:hypothetical protein